MIDELSEVPASQREVRSQLSELVMRAVRDAGDVGLRKAELVELGRAAGIIHAGVDDKRAGLWVGFAIGDAKKYFAEDGLYMLCDPKGGAATGYRYRLTDRADEAHDERVRKCKDITNRLDNLDVVTYAESVRFDRNGKIREEIIEEGLRMARKGLGWLSSAQFAAEPPRPEKARRRPVKASAVTEQASLL